MPFFFAPFFFPSSKTRSDLQQYTRCFLYQVLVSLRAAAAQGSTYLVYFTYDISIWHIPACQRTHGDIDRRHRWSWKLKRCSFQAETTEEIGVSMQIMRRSSTEDRGPMSRQMDLPRQTAETDRPLDIDMSPDMGDGKRNMGRGRMYVRTYVAPIFFWGFFLAGGALCIHIIYIENSTILRRKEKKKNRG